MARSGAARPDAVTRLPQSPRLISCLAAFLLAATVGGCGVTDTIGDIDEADQTHALIIGASRGTALFSPRPVVIKLVDGREVFGAAAAPFVHRLVLDATLTPAERDRLYREAMRRLAPPGRVKVGARAYLTRLRIDVEARSPTGAPRTDG